MHELESSLCAPGPDLSGLIAQAESFYKAAKAPATIRAFNSDLASFLAFCTRNNLPYLPSSVEAVVLYVSSLAAADPPMSYSTIRRRLSAISFGHRRRGLDSPATPRNHFVLREVLAGIRRTLGTAQHGAAPILADQIRRIVAACPDTLLGKRDRAMVLFAFGAGSRANEVALILEARDISLTDEGDLYIWLRRSKTDQDQAGRGFVVARGRHPETCPVRAIQAWIEAAGIRQSGGALFRAVNRHGKVSRHALSRRSVGKILKAAAARAGLDPTGVSPHGLRAGMCTTAALAGATEMEIAELSGHRSVATVRRYVRAADILRRNASCAWACDLDHGPEGREKNVIGPQAPPSPKTVPNLGNHGILMSLVRGPWSTPTSTRAAELMARRPCSLLARDFCPRKESFRQFRIPNELTSSCLLTCSALKERK